MKKYKLLDILKSELPTIILFITTCAIYFCTISPTVNYWDCGEFIACAHKLEVGHAPGAPFYLILARAISTLATLKNVAFTINAISALASSFTICLLYSSTLLLFKKAQNKPCKKHHKIAAFIGALTFVVSDTFWHSAIEAEVYALSLLFTSSSFWMILKWDHEYPCKGSWKWILLISFTTGVSMGIHLLNLLILPVISMVIYTRIKGQSLKNYLLAICIGLSVLLLIQYIFVSQYLFFAKKLELVFVNKFNLPIHSGSISYFAFLFLIISGGIAYFSYRNKIIQFVLTCLLLIFIGTSSYTTIIIRANANTSINLNQPTNIFSLDSYLNRQQYGYRPIMKGPWFGAIAEEFKEDYSYRINAKGIFESYPNITKIKYSPTDVSYFQRMYSSQQLHISGYKYWSNLEKNEKPTFIHQLTYFIKYQIGHMYFRYFMWNFSGRQNHFQGHGDFLNGNYLTGIPFIDKPIVGSRNPVTSTESSSNSRNIYFMIPLIFGIFGILTLLTKQNRGLFLVLAFLFLITGPAIALYLNQPPYEPRERDYVFVGSFYTFCIFIAFGANAIIKKLSQISSSRYTFWLSSIFLFIALPSLMFANNYNDHNRSDRTIARDMALSYLNSCEPNAILFTYGDNDTYPLWYLQEVEGIRQDIRVINLGLLSANWHISQQTFRQKEADPLLLSIPLHKYQKGHIDYVAVSNLNTTPTKSSTALSFIANADDSEKLTTISNDTLHYLPSNTIYLDDKSFATITLNKRYLLKGELALLDIITTNNFNRPVYFTNGSPNSAILGLEKYCIPYGMVKKLNLNKKPFELNQLINLYQNKIHINYPRRSWLDETCTQSIKVSRLIENLNQLIPALLKNNHISSAQIIMTKYNPIIGINNYQYEKDAIDWINNLYSIGLSQKGSFHLKQYAIKTIQDMHYYLNSEKYFGTKMNQYASEEYLRLNTLLAIAKNENNQEIIHIIKSSIEID